MLRDRDIGSYLLQLEKQKGEMIMRLIQIAKRGTDKTLADYFDGVGITYIRAGETINKVRVDLSGTHHSLELMMSPDEALDLAESLIIEANKLK